MDPLKRRTRRQFLCESIATAGAATIMPACSQTMTARSEKTTCTARPAWVVACRDASLRGVNETDTAAAMAAVGVEGVELTVEMDGKCPMLFGGGKAYSIATPDGVKALRDALWPHGRKVSAFCLHNAFDQRREEELDLVARTSRTAAELGVPAIRLDVVPRKIKDRDEFLRFAVDIARKILDATKDLPVRFGVENHGGTTNRPEFLRAMFDAVGDKRFGLTLDTGNFYWFGHPLSKLYDIYAEFAPWACHTHCKSIRYPEAEREKQRAMGWEYEKYFCPIDEGDIDFGRVARILRQADYRGDLCIENESLHKVPKEQHRDILRREADLLRKIARAD